MPALNWGDPSIVWVALARLLLALGLGASIGLEREIRGRPAGLRTSAFICFGAALFTIVSTVLAHVHGGDPQRIAAQIIPGIGFLGAGVIVRRGDRYHVHGLTSAACAFFAACVGVVVLLAANAAIVYPPQNDFGGFEEGLTHGDAALWMWVGIAAPPTWAVATDHRLSSMIFGFDGNPSTWTTTPALFTGKNWSAAAGELRSVGTPYQNRPIALVAVDSVMYSGVALDPSAPAIALSHDAVLWFEALPFVPLYENGQDVVYVVDSSYLPGG